MVENIKTFMAREWWKSVSIQKKFDILYEFGLNRRKLISDSTLINIWKTKNSLTEEDINNLIFEKP